MSDRKPCELCAEVRPLRKSHVIPKFVFAWIKSSGPGRMRIGNNPNQRVQDGPTEEWLCDSCEQLFSGWEKSFAERVFRPVHTNAAESKRLRYEGWALRFATSISWRTLQFYRKSGLDHLSDWDIAGSERALRAWRDFMLGGRPHPGEFEQHVLVVDTLAGSTSPVSPYLNRYLLRTIASDVLTSASHCIVFTKLCRVMVFGFIRAPSTRQWRGTKLNVHTGSIGGDTLIPSSIAMYLNEKADQTAASLATLSDKQAAKVEEMLWATDPDVLRSSEVFRAMRADVAFSGRGAFEATKRGHKQRRTSESSVGVQASGVRGKAPLK